MDSPPTPKYAIAPLHQSWLFSFQAVVVVDVLCCGEAGCDFAVDAGGGRAGLLLAMHRRFQHHLEEDNAIGAR